MNKIRKFITGLTLIEMLIVLIITAILSALMLPKIAGYRTRARLKSVYTTVEVIQIAERRYYYKHGDFYNFGLGTANTYEDGENALNIVIPRDNDIMYDINVEAMGTGVSKELYISFYERGGPSMFWFYQWKYNVTSGEITTVKNINHRLAPYVTADTESSS